MGTLHRTQPPTLPPTLQRTLLLTQLLNLKMTQQTQLTILPLQQTSVTSAISPPASKEKIVELALPLCLFLPFSFLQSLPAFCSMSCWIFNFPCLLFCSPETSFQTVRH